MTVNVYKTEGDWHHIYILDSFLDYRKPHQHLNLKERNQYYFIVIQKSCFFWKETSTYWKCGAIPLSYPPPPFCYWWLITKKCGLKLYSSPNPYPRGVQKCNCAENSRIRSSTCFKHQIKATVVPMSRESVLLLNQVFKHF